MCTCTVVCMSAVASMFLEGQKKSKTDAMKRLEVDLKNFTADYKSRLISSTMLPVCMWLELQNIRIGLGLGYKADRG